MFATLNVIEFNKKFTDTDSCVEFLANMKWNNGYKCRKCSHTEFTKGYTPCSRRCAACRYDESPTSHTIFHNLKFGLLKAFTGVFRYSRKKGMSSYELAKELGISQKTAWLFHRKLQQAMTSSEKYPLTNEVHIDEFVTGSPEPNMPGRSLGKKKKALIIVEIVNKTQIGRVYCRKIDNYKRETIFPIIKTVVGSQAKIVTDGLATYDNLSDTFSKARQVKSLMGTAFISLHQQIMNVKGWLRGIHHHCSIEHFQHYLDEFCFRTNRRNCEHKIFSILMERIASTKSSTFKELKAVAA